MRCPYPNALHVETPIKRRRTGKPTLEASLVIKHRAKAHSALHKQAETKNDLWEMQDYHARKMDWEVTDLDKDLGKVFGVRADDKHHGVVEDADSKCNADMEEVDLCKDLHKDLPRVSCKDFTKDSNLEPSDKQWEAVASGNMHKAEDLDNKEDLQVVGLCKPHLEVRGVEDNHKVKTSTVECIRRLLHVRALTSTCTIRLVSSIRSHCRRRHSIGTSTLSQRWVHFKTCRLNSITG